MTRSQRLYRWMHAANAASGICAIIGVFGSVWWVAAFAALQLAVVFIARRWERATTWEHEVAAAVERTRRRDEMLAKLAS